MILIQVLIVCLLSNLLVSLWFERSIKFSSLKRFICNTEVNLNRSSTFHIYILGIILDSWLKSRSIAQANRNFLRSLSNFWKIAGIIMMFWGIWTWYSTTNRKVKVVQYSLRLPILFLYSNYLFFDFIIKNLKMFILGFYELKRSTYLYVRISSELAWFPKKSPLRWAIHSDILGTDELSLGKINFFEIGMSVDYRLLAEISYRKW